MMSDEVDDAGNRLYTGYCVDLAKYISERIDNFSYRIVPVADAAYGSANESGQWNGMVGELIRGVRVAIRLVFLTEPLEREKRCLSYCTMGFLQHRILFTHPNPKYGTKEVVLLIPPWFNKLAFTHNLHRSDNTLAPQYPIQRKRVLERNTRIAD